MEKIFKGKTLLKAKCFKGKTKTYLIKKMKLTIKEIRKASNSKLRNLLKEDLPIEIHDMISKELFEIREEN